MTRRHSKIFLFLILSFLSIQAQAKEDFQKFVQAFIDGYTQLGIPEIEYDYRDYLKAIPSAEVVGKQKQFFLSKQKELGQFNLKELSRDQLIRYDHLSYEIGFNLFRIFLEEEWINAGRPIPAGGIHTLPDHKNWYGYFAKKFTSTNTTPEQLYSFGIQQVQRVQNEIKTLRLALGFNDSFAFYKQLQNDSFYLTDKTTIIQRFEKIDSIVRGHLPAFIMSGTVPAVYAM